MRPERGLIARLSRCARGLLLALLVCAAGLVVGRPFLAEQLDEQIRAHVERVFSAHYAQRGWVVRVDAARRLEGQGIEIRGFSIRARGAAANEPPCLTVDELLLACRTDVTDLVLAAPDVTCLTLRRMRVRATRDPAGRWNVARLLPLPDLDGSVPRMLVEDATIELHDLGRRAEGSWAFREINVRLDQVASRGGPPQWRFVGTLLGDHFKRVKFQGTTDSTGQVWSAGGTIDGLEISQRMLGALPADLAGYAGFLTALRARAHFDFQIGHGPQSTAPVDFILQGHVAEGRVEDPRLPLALTNLEADVWCDNQQLRIEGVTAQSGTADLNLSCQWDGFLGPAPRLQLAAEVRRLQVDERLYPLLPSRLQAEWNKFAPRGTVDVTARLVVADETVEPEIDIQCHDVSFSYHAFPLRLQQGQGAIRVAQGRVRIPAFTAVAGGQTVRLAAELTDLGPHVTGWFTAESAGPIPLNEEFLSALQPAAQKNLRALHPTGAITVTRGRVEKRAPDAPPQSQWEIELHDCAIQYDRFPYPMDRISGTLTLAGRRWMLRDGRGRHGSGYLTCSGDWTPAADGQAEGRLQLQFQCWDLPLDESLQAALGTHHPGVAQLWDSVRPRGSIDHVSLVVRHDTATRATGVDLQAEKWPPSQNVPGRTITCYPAWLPLRLEDVVGQLTFRDGRFELHNVSAVRGASRIELAGAGQVAPDNRWEVTLSRVIADRLAVDRELIEALPEGMRPALRQLQYRGVVSLNGRAWFRGGPAVPLASGWDLLLDLENGALENELQIEHLHGAIRLCGQKLSDGSFSSGGALEIDSLVTRGTQCTQLQGPLWFDRQQLLLGSRAAPAQPGVEPQSVTAKAMGGQITLDAQLLLSPELPFSADVALADASVVDIARLLHTEVPDIRGRVFALVHLQGARAGLHTLQGQGQVRLREADIYELPVMARLLGVLSLRQPDEAAFTSSDVDFRINGEQVYFDRIDFSGDLLRLKGQGWMDLGRQLNLDFYALVGRGELQLPILKTILAQASRSILQIQVLGTVDQPQVIRKALPELDETLQRMFPEAIPRTAAPRTPWTRAQ